MSKSKYCVDSVFYSAKYANRAGVISSIPAGRFHNTTFRDNKVGRYVNILLPGSGRLLTLCEVEVYGYLESDSKHYHHEIKTLTSPFVYI